MPVCRSSLICKLISFFLSFPLFLLLRKGQILMDFVHCRCDKNGDGKLSEDEVREVIKSNGSMKFLII